MDSTCTAGRIRQVLHVVADDDIIFCLLTTSPADLGVPADSIHSTASVWQICQRIWPSLVPGLRYQ